MILLVQNVLINYFTCKRSSLSGDGRTNAEGIFFLQRFKIYSIIATIVALCCLELVVRGQRSSLMARMATLFSSTATCSSSCQLALP